MPAPFAALEQRVNAATHSRLSNASAVFDGVVEPVEGVFDSAYDEILGVDSEKPVFRCLESAIVGVVARTVSTPGTAVTIRAIDYEVIGLEPDRTGSVLVRLQVAE